MKKIKFLLLLSFIFFLHACTGSPVHTSSMTSSQLTSVDDYTLCKAATPREFYSPKPHVISEVRKRGLSCGSIYQYTPININDWIITPQNGTQPLPNLGSYTCSRHMNVVTCNSNSGGRQINCHDHGNNHLVCN